MCTEFLLSLSFSLCVAEAIWISWNTEQKPFLFRECVRSSWFSWYTEKNHAFVWQTFSIIFYFRECLLTWRCEDTTVRTTPRCAGSSRRGCTRTGGRRIGGNKPLKISHWVTSNIFLSSFWRRIMTGAAVKASAFQVLLLALLFVFTPSLFHLVLFEVFSFLNFLTPWCLWRSQNQA